MATASGVSVKGAQTLVLSTSAPSKLLSIAITNKPTPPIIRLGYFYLFQFVTTTPFQSYVVETGLLTAPGLLVPIRLAPLAANYNFRLDVVWNVPGFSWTATIA